jgi:hypothetical protein
MFHKNNYKKLAKFLEQNGYRVIEREEEEVNIPSLKIHHPGFKSWHVTGNGILAMFCTPNSSSYPYIRGKIAADNVRCFDKWSKAPLVMNVAGIDYNRLLEALTLLGSEEGYKVSNSYDYLDSNPFPYEMD